MITTQHQTQLAEPNGKPSLKTGHWRSRNSQDLLTARGYGFTVYNWCLKLCRQAIANGGFGVLLRWLPSLRQAELMTASGIYDNTLRESGQEQRAQFTQRLSTCQSVYSPSEKNCCSQPDNASGHKTFHARVNFFAEANAQQLALPDGASCRPSHLISTDLQDEDGASLLHAARVAHDNA
jgi:hypothetical protein